MSRLVKASDCPCCVCGQPAVAFWPVIDPDIPANPYCRPCLDKAQQEMLIKLYTDKKTDHKQ